RSSIFSVVISLSLHDALPISIVGEDPEGKLAHAYDPLRDVYLATWSEYAPPARLRQLFEIGKTLGGLHQAVSYQQIVRSVEPAADRKSTRLNSSHERISYGVF